MYYDTCRQGLEKGVAIGDLVKLPVREAIGRFKYLPDQQVSKGYDDIAHQLEAEVAALINSLERGDR